VAVTHSGSGRARLLELAHELTAEATKQGLSRPELIELLEQL
jgi:pyrroline-5-carboxylate reductase